MTPLVLRESGTSGKARLGSFLLWAVTARFARSYTLLDHMPELVPAG